MKGVVFYMKKFLVFICLLALVSFAGAAFGDEAGHGGHVNTDASINTTPTYSYSPASGDITTSSGTVSINELDQGTPSTFVVANIYLPTDTANKVSVRNNIVIEIKGYTVGDALTVSFANYTDANTENLYAFLIAKENTSSIYTEGKFYAFKCTVTDNVLSFTVDEPEVFFTESTVTLATVETFSTSGSSGGCNAGYAGLLLFAAVPFFFRKKK